VSLAWRCGGEALPHPHTTVPTNAFVCCSAVCGTDAESTEEEEVGRASRRLSCGFGCERAGCCWLGH